MHAKRRDPGLGPDSRGLPSEPFDRDHEGMPASLPGLLRVRRRPPRRRRHPARPLGLQGRRARRALHGPRRRHRPLHVSIVGGEPLVRYRELGVILPRLAERGIHTQLVTSAVRPIPMEWAGLRRLQVVVSIDGLPPEHDERRTPATYDRILKHIAGHQITVHCTVTRQQARREGYLEEFLRLWQENPDTRLIWVSLYTPQKGEISAERLTAADRARVIADLRRLRGRDPEAADARRDAERLRAAAGNARGLHLRADDRVLFFGPRAADHAVSVRRQSRLLELRLHRVGGARGDRPAPAARRHSGGPDLLRIPSRRKGGRRPSFCLAPVGRDFEHDVLGSRQLQFPLELPSVPSCRAPSSPSLPRTSPADA